VQQRPEHYANVKSLISQLYHQHKGRYGYRRIHLALRMLGHWINHKTVQKLMNQLGLKSIVRPKRYKSYRGNVGKVAPNHLSRAFQTGRPNEKWVTDVTEFNVRGEKLYLSPILDLYNQEIVSYQLAESPRLDIVMKMLSGAIHRLRPHEQPMLHSDQGWQYQMGAYQQQLQQRGITQSMSRKGNCLDNAVMENFFGILKTEFFYRNKFDSVESLKRGLKEYIHYYNHDRIKQKLKGLSPVNYRTQSFPLTT
jgi:transposase InsO family protein